MANQHFFKPLLPGFHSHLTIPVAFFFKNIEGRNEHKTADLRSDTSKKTWKVKIDGQRLTNGWREFALAHDLRIGDIIVFRQERDMAFHVTMLGPNCCEIQYVSCLDNQNNLGELDLVSSFSGKIQRKKKEVESSLDLSCFVANVTSSNLRFDSLNLPMCFVRANGLDKRCGEMILMNEKGRSWTVSLKRKKSCATTYIRRGWRSFCHSNGLRAGDFFTFKLFQRGGTLGLRLSQKELEEEANAIDNNQDERSSRECTKRNLILKASSLPSQNRFVTVTLTPYNVGQSKLILPVPFTKVNGIVKAKKMSFLDKHGVKWSTNLWFEEKCKRMRLSGGWKEFCYANGVKIGESIILEFLWEADRSSVLKFCSKVKPENK
ncbi:DNA-binding pseudobarrel domain superfamily [Arabidopsis thaliana x Arabidopsis arenosa]|uniref:DNA-binding pseudobarrel domain superfamily n=1 Tax=Arabidopsis thaliana x Arabidopsis arenosa TaxID=1240361 RepID=A0A8T2A6Q6_9BRAS|nr:DNA-binding pseudobarrel domain superfamily [Arabidopsis thaliana x Arabidopsis arenosa]